MLEDELKHNGYTLEEGTAEEIASPIMKRLSLSSLDELYAAIGYGGVTATRVANRMRDELVRASKSEKDKKTVIDKINQAAERREQNALKQGKAVHGILVEGISNCLVKFSRCCTPVPGDDIVGFITRGQGVSIHRTDCENYLKRRLDPENEGRWVNVSWAEEISDTYVSTLNLTAKNRGGLVMDIAVVLNTLNAKVRTLTARELVGGLALASVTLEVKNSGELKYIISRLSTIPGVTQVTRNGN